MMEVEFSATRFLFFAEVWLEKITQSVNSEDHAWRIEMHCWLIYVALGFLWHHLVLYYVNCMLVMQIVSGKLYI